MACISPAKYATWQDGQFELKGLVGRERSEKWGTTRSENGLRQPLREKHGAEGGDKLAAQYLDPVRREAAQAAAATRAAKETAGSGGGGKGGRPTVTGRGSSGDSERRRQERLTQLGRVTDVDFAAEVQSHQRATWRRASLEEHARKHWRDFEERFGRGLSPSELEEVTATALASWDRLFTELDREGDVSYAFAAQWTERGKKLGL